MSPRFSRKVSLNASDFRGLYAARRFLSPEIHEKARLTIPFEVYFQDPLVAQEDPELGIDRECLVDWEPGLADGPTSARFAVVDYNADTGTLAPPAEWDATRMKFVHDGKVLGGDNTEPLQFDQVNVWAILQRALAFFEGPSGLGRRVPWGFEGNRLIVVPHAGYGENAYYDRRSKSLQFYYFDRQDDGQARTCLSTDIVHHEFGHAVLDGVRPHLNESASVETGAFHEFVGDLTAVLITLRNNEFRKKLMCETQEDPSGGLLAGIAEEFGKETKGRPYLRSARNALTMDDVRDSASAHEMSQVLTGAMFELLLRFSLHYENARGRPPGDAYWDAMQRIQRTAIQPLDFLPPVDVTFRDYALAVLRNQEIADPQDPHGYRDMMLEVFVRRGVLEAGEADKLRAKGYLHDRLRLDVFHSVEEIGASRANAYRFLDDNREKLGIPANRDVLVTGLYSADKYAREAQWLPRQLVVEYLWREDVLLEGERFGRLAGKWTAIPCGGTLVFDENETLLWWARKAGSETGGKEGKRRLSEFLDNVERLVRSGRAGRILDSEKGLLATRLPPFTERTVDGSVRIELTPHLNLSADHKEREGDRQWEISS